MKQFLLSLLFLSLISAPSLAQEWNSQGEMIKNCLTKHDNHGADYVEGMDVDGNKVAPANLQSIERDKNLDVIEIPVTIDLASRLTSMGLEFKPRMGDIKVYKDGKVEWDGQDISSKMADFCMSSPSMENNLSAPMPLMPDDNMSPQLNLPVPATVSPSVTTTQ